MFYISGIIVRNRARKYHECGVFTTMEKASKPLFCHCVLAPWLSRSHVTRPLPRR